LACWSVAVTRDNSLALAQLGNFRTAQGRYPEALEAYREALRIEPQMEEPQLNVGVLLYMTGHR
jgi:cytochrome c-type biogenesis protein CcmH/NrfG